MNQDELLDNELIFGDKHLFLVRGNFLFIYKGKLVTNEHLRKIPIETISDLQYVEGKIGKSVGTIALEIVGMIITEGGTLGIGNIDRNRLEIDYEVEGEIASGAYETTLEEGDFNELRSLLSCRIR